MEATPSAEARGAGISSGCPTVRTDGRRQRGNAQQCFASRAVLQTGTFFGQGVAVTGRDREAGNTREANVSVRFLEYRRDDRQTRYANAHVTADEKRRPIRLTVPVCWQMICGDF